MTMLDQVQDVDSHEMIPAHLLPEAFGEAGARWAKVMEIRQQRVGDYGPNCGVHPDVEDVMEITPQSVWNAKGAEAPGAIDLGRRTEVLDTMGIKSQLVFPTFGFAALVVLAYKDVQFNAWFAQELADREELARAMVKAHNDWVVGGLKVDSERVRVVAIVPTESLDEMMAEAGRLLEGG